MEVRQSFALVEVDQAIYNGYDVVDTKDKRVKHTGADQLQTTVHIVKLRQGEDDESYQDDPGLPAVELVVAVDDGAHQQLDSALCDEQRVCRENAAHAAVEHASKQTQARRWARVHVVEEPIGDKQEEHDDGGHNHPHDEVVSSQQGQQLVQVVRGLSDGAKEGDEEGAGGDEHGADEGVAGEGLVQDDGGAYRVEDEAGGLQGGEDGQRQGGDLDGAAHDVGHDEHEHAQLPAPALVRRAAGIVVFLLFLEQV